MKNRREKLISIVASLVLIFNILVPSTISAQELVKSNSKNVIGTVNVGVYGNSEETTREVKNVELLEGDTVYSVIKRVVGSEDVDTMEIGSIVILNSIFGLEDKSTSGWRFAINRDYEIMESASSIKLNAGDELIYHYDSNKMNTTILNSFNKFDEFLNSSSQPVEDVNLSISIERRVLGQSDILEETDIKAPKGQKLSKVVDKVFKENNIDYTFSGDINNNYFISFIKNEDEVIEMGSHGDLSGWMYSVNGVRENLSLDKIEAAEGQKIRIYYSAKDFGLDIDAVDKIYEVREKIKEVESIDMNDYTIASAQVLSESLEYAKAQMYTDEEIGKMMSTTLGTGDADTEDILLKMENCLSLLQDSIDDLEVRPETTNPIIEANDIEIKQYDELDLLKGVIAKDDLGDLTDKIEITENNVDTSKVGIYEVTYKVTTVYGESITKSIKVKVQQPLIGINAIPVIKVESEIVEIKVGEEFNPLKGVSAEDQEDGDLTDKIEVIENDVETSKAGEYKVTYKVADSNGASVEKSIVVIVSEEKVSKEDEDNNQEKLNEGDKSDISTDDNGKSPSTYNADLMPYIICASIFLIWIRISREFS